MGHLPGMVESFEMWPRENPLVPSRIEALYGEGKLHSENEQEMLPKLIHKKGKADPSGEVSLALPTQVLNLG